MPLYRVVRELLEELYVEAGTPQEAKKKVPGMVGEIYDSQIVDVDCEERCENEEED